MIAKRNNFTKILLKYEVINSSQLKSIEKEIEKTDLPLIKAINKVLRVAENDLFEMISEKIGVPFVDVSDYIFHEQVINLVPKDLILRFKLIPLFKVGQRLTIGMVNPKDIVAIDKIRQITPVEDIDTVLVTESMISGLLEKSYQQDKKDKYQQPAEFHKDIVKEKDLDGKEIIKLVNSLIEESVRSRASDIHIEPDKDTLRLRYRIDGVLHEITTFPKRLQNSLVSRIKLMASMDIAESRLPQDGKINIQIADKDLDIRVSSFPVVSGENIVMRILHKSSVVMGLYQLGLASDDLERFQKLVRCPYGIVLVTGPTGSGKTTTLYGVLTTINSMEKNILTIEDPVEYELPLIRQTQINPKAGLTFANELRAILRQDPDVIMVGEIRDTETAKVAIQAALTGHLVLSTLHTNDSTSAVNRLIDMKVEPFLVSSTLMGVLAQRLVRLICEECKEKEIPSKEIVQDLNLDKFAIKSFYRGKGCSNCKDTGFLGRTGLFELLVVDDELRSLIADAVSSDDLRKVAVKKKMKTLYSDGLYKVKKGLTSLDEVLRVSGGSL